ncbi:MAG: cyclic nucleotide-binding domain-containing protein, partial [Cyanobacteria bacterium P01_F01_bin.42]
RQLTSISALQESRLTQDFNSILAPLASGDLQWLQENGDRQTVRPKHVLIQEGQKLNFILLLLQGTAYASSSRQPDADDLGTELGRISAPSLLGELSYMDSRRPVASVIAQSTCEVVEISHERLTAKLKGDRLFARNWYKTIAQLLSQRLRMLTNVANSAPLGVEAPLPKVLLFFSILQDADVDWFIHAGTMRQLAVNETLIAQGQPVADLSFVLSGKLAVEWWSGSPNHNPQILDRLSAGAIAGEMSLLEDQTASASVIAQQPSALLCVDKLTLSRLLQVDTAFAGRFYQAVAMVLANRIRNTLYKKGLSVSSYQPGDRLSESLQYDDEINFDTLDRSAIAARRFDWLVNRVSQISATQ